MSIKTKKQQDAFAIRVLLAMRALGGLDIMSQQLAKCMDADKYDILFALHQLKGSGKVEQVDTNQNKFSDCWQLPTMYSGAHTYRVLASGRTV